MLILEFAQFCNKPYLTNYLIVVKKILLLIQIAVPIMLLIWGSVGFIRLVINPDEKSGVKKIVNKFLAAVFVFMIPVIMNVVMGMLGEKTNFSNCWNQAKETYTAGHVYVDPYNEERGSSSIIGNPSDYEKGVKKPQTNPSSGSNSSSNPSSTGASNPSGPSANKRIFVGDSRTVQMYAYLSSDWNGANYSSGGAHVVGSDVFIAQGSMGLDWLKSTGIPAAQKYFGSGSALIILMGVNDTYNASNYVSYINSNSSSWSSSGTKIYFSAVTPCNGRYNSHNSEIVNFNSTIRSGLSNSVSWLDTYGHLISSGYMTTDGLHYDQSTSNKIYNYIKNNV